MKTKILILILGIAALIRLVLLASVPPHLTSDEASLGYNAYSILKTGKDEYGQVFPMIFKSFGDYKPGLYVYLTVPSILVFGLSEFGVRFPSAFAGILSVFLLYLIVKKLFDERLALISAFVLAVTPWAVYFSRGAWEANVALAFTLSGIYFFLKSLEKSKFIIPSSVFFALTLLTYQGAKLATAIIVIILVCLYWRKFIRFPKIHILSAIFVGLVISIPILVSVFRGQTGRLTVFSIFSYPRTEESLNAFLGQAGEKIGDLNYYLFHSETLNFKRAILGRWFNHFSGRFLFFEGDWSNPRHSAPYQGMLLLSDIILIVLGFVALVRKGLSKSTALVWLWLILSPLPSALTRNEVHSIRAMNMVIPLVIILSFGLQKILSSKYFKFAYFVVFLLSFAYFLDAYFIHLPIHQAKLWEYGYKQIVKEITPIQKNYQRIVVQQSFAQPYIYFLFYQKYDPNKYQKQAVFSESGFKGDVGYVNKLDNIEFTIIKWTLFRGDRGTLFAADPETIPPKDSSDPNLFRVIADIKYPDGIYTAFRVLEVK
jgi:4-amino-4-deoxy-L-arabinose transferase-like glycosyltransferase